MAVHDMDWWLERLEVARTNSSTRGKRDVHAACPVCHGSDPLHLTEQNGRALLNCFNCNAKYDDIVSALEDAAEPPPTIVAEVTPEVASGAITKRRRSRTISLVEAPPIADPLAWYAEYCGVDLEWLKAEIPVRATSDGWIAHYWNVATVVKERKAGTGDRRWNPTGATAPRLWPEVSDSLPEEIWLTEGETDCIVLRSLGIEAYTAGSASQPLSADEMKYLRSRDVARIVVAYDNDKAGAKATQETLSAAKECGLGVSIALLGDPLLGGPKDWRERHLSGDHTVPEIANHSAKEIWVLSDVEPAVTTKLLLEKLHPEDHTILFGDGGTGKGVIAAWWAAQLTRLEHPLRVLVLDYEEHARFEWRPRIERFGGDLDAVHIWQPQEPIWDIASAVHTIIEEKKIDYVMVDSVVYACQPEEAEKSVTAAQYNDAIRQFRRPVLSLAHVTKADPEPKHPFGSMVWSAGARITIGISTVGPELDSPRKLRFVKVNQGGDNRPTQIDWSWVTGELPTTLNETAFKIGHNDLVLESIAALGGSATLADLRADLVDVAAQELSNTLQDLKAKGQVGLNGKAWSIITPITITRRKSNAPA